jgi:hypothetical protein
MTNLSQFNHQVILKLAQPVFLLGNTTRVSRSRGETIRGSGTAHRSPCAELSGSVAFMQRKLTYQGALTIPQYVAIRALTAKVVSPRLAQPGNSRSAW